MVKLAEVEVKRHGIECVRGDLKDFGLKVKDTENKYDWREEVFGKTYEPCKQGKTDAGQR